MEEAARAETDKVDILVVDDQPQKLLAYDAILGPLGENVLRAGSGREALETLLKREIAVLLLDVVMPEMDGFELAHIVRSHPRFAKTPIIFVTAFSTTELERLRAYELGAVDYVYVPIVPEVLRAKVAVFADLHRKTRALLEINRGLELRVAERTAELQRTALELRERAERLAEADRVKDEFLAMLGHELRNPLSTVLSALEILRRPRTGEPMRSRAVEMAERQVQHLTRILDDLLDVSRITQGKIALHTERLLLRDVVERVVESTREIMNARRHELKVALPEEPIWLEADPTRMEQILFNLLANAAKFTAPGGHVDLTIERAPSQITIRVRDDGVGMDGELLPRVFDLFTQASRSLDRAEGGLGIGLTMVRRLVELHGGQVSASSAGAGSGSEFTVRLPSASAPHALEQGPEPVDPGGAPRRVLIVEDNADAAETLATLLEVLGHEVSIARSGREAVLQASALRPDVVILDIGLPGLDGYETARLLRRDEALDGVTLVALTGYVREDDRRRSREAGFDHHLAKPVDLDTLAKVLERGTA